MMTKGQINKLSIDRTPPRRLQLHDGREKILYDGPEPGTHVLYFKDQIVESGQLIEAAGKGVINNRISELFFRRLGEMGVDTHLVRGLNMREQLVRAADVYPFRIKIHNVAVGEFAQRLGLSEGQTMPFPLPELQMRASQTPSVLSQQHLVALGWAQEAEADDLISMAGRVNDFLSGQFLALGMKLLSVSLEFGRWYYLGGGEEFRLILVDEISPDTCEIQDIETGLRMDRSLLVVDPEAGLAAYREVARRLSVLGDGVKPWEDANEEGDDGDSES